MDNPHDLIYERYDEKNLHLWCPLFRKFPSLLRSALLYYLHPEAQKLLYFIKSISKLCSVWYLFKIMCPKPELNIIWTRQFLDMCSSSTEVCVSLCVCVWEGGGGSYWRPWWFKRCQYKLWKLLKHFKLSITFLTCLILGLSSPQIRTKSYRRKKT